MNGRTELKAEYGKDGRIDDNQTGRLSGVTWGRMDLQIPNQFLSSVPKEDKTS